MSIFFDPHRVSSGQQWSGEEGQGLKTRPALLEMYHDTLGWLGENPLVFYKIISFYGKERPRRFFQHLVRGRHLSEKTVSGRAETESNYCYYL
jgi:hypothetical protein